MRTIPNLSSQLKPVSVSVSHAAELLGISTRTVWNYLRDGTLPAARLGRRILIPYGALQELIDSLADYSGRCVDKSLSERRKATARGGAR